MGGERKKNQKKISSYLSSIIILLISSGLSYSQSTNSQFTNYSFENISNKIDLPNSSITCILQDHIGYLWLGTQNGLARYDGYSTKIFQPKEHDNSSISDRGIVTIYEDKKNTIWVGTLNGLNKLNRADNSFKCYKHIPGDSSSISADSIQCIFEDDSGKFWIGTDKGLNLFNRQKEVFTSYYFKNKDLSSAGSSKSSQYLLGINAIIEDPASNDLLIGTDKDGLWKFSPKEKVFSKYMIKIDPNSDKKISWIQSFFKSRGGKIWMISDHTLTTLNVYTSEFKLYIDFPIPDHHYVESPCYALGTVAEGREGQIWAGFIKGENGVFCINQKTGRISQYKLDPNAEKNTYDNMIFAVFYDRSEIMWIGTLDRGLWKLNQQKSNFQLFKYNPQNQNSISNIKVYDIIYDPRGFLWISTRSALDRYDIKKGTFSHYLKNEKCLTNNRYKAVLDKSGNIWIGSEFGLMKFNTITAAYRFYCNDPHSLNLINKSIFRMLLDKQGNLWIGTMGSGLYRYNIKANKLTLFEHDSNDSSSLSADQIRALYEDRTGTLWVGTNENGLNKFNSETEEFTHYGFKCVSPMYEDKFGNFWVSEYFTGLNLFDPVTGKITENYNPNNGLSFTEIAQIVEDNSGNLWLGTRHGLSKFNIKTRTFKNYYIKDGIPDDFFLAYHPAKDSNGKIYFITRAGLLIFHPDSIKIDSIPPQTILSNVSLFNRPNPKINYSGFISELKEVVLPYNFNDLRFDFIGFHFNEPSSNKYKYILENFDDDWVNAGTQRNATYTNLTPGKYIFKVMASNKDGIWDKKWASIKIIITSPWWQTTFAYILFALIIICTIYIIWKMQLKRIKIKHDFQIRNLEAEKLRELDEMKSRFFTNISHEFRTPLTMILGPSKQIWELTKNDKIKEDADIIHRSAKKLNRLADQLLDLSRIEAGKMKLKTSKQNLIPVIKEIVVPFQSFAEGKKISLKFSSAPEEIILYIDKDKIDKILNNILSNAIKFTPNGGLVSIRAEYTSAASSTFPKPDNEDELKEEFVAISVSDTGIGIPPEQLNKIFDRFYQVDNKLSKEYEGTGVGLSLTKELV
ncbi:MAG: two-component regulator propeller domain-containing protein, partial [Ignavibacteriaceae bacterium]